MTTNPSSGFENDSSDLADAWRNTPSHKSGTAHQGLGAKTLGGGALPIVFGACFSAGFYAVVLSVSWAPLQRYFLGHPVAVAATILFWIAVAILMCKWWQVNQQSIYLDTIRDHDLMPAELDEAEPTPAGKWIVNHDAGHVARHWLSTLGALPSISRASQLVRRLEELLTRQSQRGTSKHLADDLRELSGRDADAAHDSLGLVRIIIWAIPMLGFLGTVIGITQTLGGLDFTDGTAAVDRLKSGLYVAFDTTALGLVLSVVAIFIQFPIERAEQVLLSTIDHRIGHLVSACLPSDEAADNQTELIVDLCEGIRAAVAESIAGQAKLWRETIDEAQSHWQQLQQENANRIAEAFEGTLAPALAAHAAEFNQSANALAQSAATTSDKLQTQGEQWQATMTMAATALASHHQTMMNQCEQLADVNEQTKAIASLQASLDANLQRLDATNRGVERSVLAAGGDGMNDAMRTLAQAIEILSRRLPIQPTGTSADSAQTRRAA